MKTLWSIAFLTTIIIAPGCKQETNFKGASAKRSEPPPTADTGATNVDSQPQRPPVQQTAPLGNSDGTDPYTTDPNWKDPYSTTASASIPRKCARAEAPHTVQTDCEGCLQFVNVQSSNQGFVASTSAVKNYGKSVIFPNLVDLHFYDPKNPANEVLLECPSNCSWLPPVTQ